MCISASPPADTPFARLKESSLDGREHRFILIGPLGAVQFVYMTTLDGKDLAVDLGYHSRTPRYEDQSITRPSCPYLNDEPCYYDGSSLNADTPLRIYRHDGEEALWSYLNNYYNEVFALPTT